MYKGFTQFYYIKLNALERLNPASDKAEDNQSRLEIEKKPGKTHGFYLKNEVFPCVFPGFDSLIAPLEVTAGTSSPNPHGPTSLGDFGLR